MFGVGGPEMVVILVLALILIGPDKLPKVAKTLGEGMRDLRRAANMAQAELRETVDDLMREVERDPAAPQDDAERHVTNAATARELAREKAQKALAAARASGAPGADGPTARSDDTGDDTGDNAGDTVGVAVDDRDAASTPPGASDSAQRPEVRDAPAKAAPPPDAAAAPADAPPAEAPPAEAEAKAKRRRDLNELLAAEAMRFDESRRKIAHAQRAGGETSASLRTAASPVPPGQTTASAGAATVPAGVHADDGVEGTVARGAFVKGDDDSAEGAS